MDRKTVPSDFPGQLLTLVTLSCSTALTAVKPSPHPQPRQEQRPPSVTRALMEEG